MSSSDAHESKRRSIYFQSADPRASLEVLSPDYEPLSSLVLPVDGQRIVFTINGNALTLTVKGDEVVLQWSRRVRNCVQLQERQKLVHHIRRLDEAVGQLLEQLAEVRGAWRLRGTPPDAFERVQYDSLQKKFSLCNANFVADCSILHGIWKLDPELGSEVNECTVRLDNNELFGILLPDWRPGEEGKDVEARFRFGCVEAPPTSNATVKMLSATVTVVPDCIAPYRPFNVPAVWRNDFSAALPHWENPSTHRVLE